jgi:SAM-dependent methyltransferase
MDRKNLNAHIGDGRQLSELPPSRKLLTMSSYERNLYNSYLTFALNQALLPVKLLVPQPIISKLPILKTNHQIRTGLVLQAVHGRLLDIGCGENYLVQQYRSAGADGLGVDVYPWPNVDRIVEDTAKLPFEDGSFDTITFVACINHIPNRVDVLREARRVLAPGGKVVLTNLTPTLSRLWHRWAFWDDDQHERGMKPGEVYGFTHEDLVALLSEAGYRLVERRPFSWHLNCLYTFEPKI